MKAESTNSREVQHAITNLYCLSETLLGIGKPYDTLIKEVLSNKVENRLISKNGISKSVHHEFQENMYCSFSPLIRFLIYIISRNETKTITDC